MATASVFQHDVGIAKPAAVRVRVSDIAIELKRVMRLAGRSPEALEGQLDCLSQFKRVTAEGELDESARVHVIVHRLIPEYLERLPDGPDCRAIRELLAWQDGDGDLQSLTTRYHKASAHLIAAASDFGRRQEPRLLRDCARRFIAFDHEDRLPGPRAVADGVADDATARNAALAASAPVGRGTRSIGAGDSAGEIVRVHRNLDYRLLADRIADAQQIAILNTWIPGIDVLADALVAALARGARISILLLDPDSPAVSLRDRALQAPSRVDDGRVGSNVRHCLDVLTAVSQIVDIDRRQNLSLRLYDSLPSLCAYAIDDLAFVSFFLHGQLSVNSMQLEVLGRDSLMGRLVFGEISTLWNTARSLEQRPLAAALAG